MFSSMLLILSSFSTSDDKSACQRKLSKKISGIKLKAVVKIESNTFKIINLSDDKNPEKHVKNY